MTRQREPHKVRDGQASAFEQMESYHRRMTPVNMYFLILRRILQ